MTATLDAELAMLADAVYLPSWQAVEHAIAPHWQLAVPLDIGNSEAMLCRRGAEVTALVFRGTEFSRGSLADLRANFGGWSTWAGPGSLHAGYAGYVAPIFDAARAAASQLAGAPLYLAGHSLGGAAAAIYAARNAAEPGGHVVDGLVTFGAPACFNAAAAATLAGLAIRRHVIAGDFAPGWPINPWVCHAGGAIEHQPPRAGLSSVARHEIGLYRQVLRAAVG